MHDFYFFLCKADDVRSLTSQFLITMQKLFRNLILLLLLTLAVSPVFSQKQECPRGAVDCKGRCGWYIDHDGDKFCDYTNWSKECLQKKQRTADSLAAVAKEAAHKKKCDSIEARSKAQNKAGQATNAKDLKQSNPAMVTESKTAQQATVPAQPSIKPAEVQSGPPASTKSKYDLILILFACTTLYIFTFLLARRDVIKKVTHRKIWNTVLLITFLVSGLLGLFLAIQLNYNIKINWFSSLLFWHVEFGIAMAGISIFHTLWHLKYYLNLFSHPGGRIKNS